MDITYNNGARFIRADLHIHSYGKDSGSFDVTDQEMTPEKIVDTAIDSNLQISPPVSKQLENNEQSTF